MGDPKMCSKAPRWGGPRTQGKPPQNRVQNTVWCYLGGIGRCSTWPQQPSEDPPGQQPRVIHAQWVPRLTHYTRNARHS